MIELSRTNGIKVTKYPDGQTSAVVSAVPDEAVTLRWPLRSNDDLILLMQISQALDDIGAVKCRLYIPYLLGARSDKRSTNQSFDLGVIAQIINACNFQHIDLLDPHSEVASALIERSRVMSNEFLVAQYLYEDAVLICPDAGQVKKVPSYLKWIRNGVHDVATCMKHRDPKTGKIELKVLNPEICKRRNCVIIDDICDGGATFVAIADQIEAQTKSLIVTHGIFSKGFDELFARFSHIYTTDSYRGESWEDARRWAVSLSITKVA